MRARWLGSPAGEGAVIIIIITTTTITIITIATVIVTITTAIIIAILPQVSEPRVVYTILEGFTSSQPCLTMKQRKSGLDLGTGLSTVATYLFLGKEVSCRWGWDGEGAPLFSEPPPHVADTLIPSVRLRLAFLLEAGNNI
jgi:hypothetical protein